MEKLFEQYLKTWVAFDEKQVDLYNATDGAFDLLNVKAVINLSEVYLELLALYFEIDIEELYQFIGDFELGKKPETVEKNKKRYTIDSIHNAWRWFKEL